MAIKIRAHTTLNLPRPKQNEELSQRFKNLLIWDNKPLSEAATATRKRLSDAHSKADTRRIIDDRLDLRDSELASQGLLEEKIIPLSNPNDPYDDLNVFWNPEELLAATKALSSYNVKGLYTKDPYTVKKTLHLIFLIIKYKPLLKDLLEVGEYFQRFPEDEKDENIVFIALFDILCRGNEVSLESEMDVSLRMEYKNIGLKVVYMQVERDKVHYFEQVHERLNDIGACSVHDLLPNTIPMQINIEFPMIFDVWINISKFEMWPEKLLEEAGFKRVGTRTSNKLTYNEIVDMPYFFELGVSNYAEFVKSSHYCNHVFIPTDRNHCLAMAQLVKQLYKGGIIKGTIIQTHILSLGATAYFAYLLSIAFPTSIKLKVFGADKMKESFESYFSLLDLKNVKVFSERFYIVNCRKKDIASTTCVLVNPETVFKPSVNLIEETFNRGCDIVYLQSAYELISENDIYNYSFINQHIYDLKELAKYNMRRALSIPKVKFVVYQSFDPRETAVDNIASYVVNFARECSYTSISTVKGSMSPTEMEDANYKYCKQLNLYFRQGNTLDCIISPSLWGSKPPFINIIYRVDPVIRDTETEGEINDKSSFYGKRSSRCHSLKSLPPAREKHLRKFSSISSSNTERRRTKLKNADSDVKKVIKKTSAAPSSRSGQSSIFSSIKNSATTLMQVRESAPDFKKMVLSEVMFKNEPINIPSVKEEAVLKKILKKKRSKNSSKVESEKKEVLFIEDFVNTDLQQTSETDKSSQNVKKQSISSYDKPETSKKMSSKEEESIVLEDVSVNVEVESIPSHETPELKNVSQVKGKKKKPSSQSAKTKPAIEQNKRFVKKESTVTKDIPFQSKKTSDKALKKEPSSNKTLARTPENTDQDKPPRKLKKINRMKRKETLLIAQHSSPNISEINNPESKERKSPKKFYIPKQAKMSPKPKTKVEKEAPIISFGTIIRPKSKKQIDKKLPLKREKKILKKNADFTEMSSTTSLQKIVNKHLNINKEATEKEMSSEILSRRKSEIERLSIKSDEDSELKRFHRSSRKKLYEMEERFKKEIFQSFQANFFQTTNQSDLEDKSASGRNHPSSTVSWRTYSKTARKLSELKLIKMLQKGNSKKRKKKRKKSSIKRSESNMTSAFSGSEVGEIPDDQDTKFSKKSETVLWSEYEPVDFYKLMEIDKNELKSVTSSILEMDKIENNSITSSFLEIEEKEIKPSVVLPRPVSPDRNKEKMIPKRKKSLKKKRKKRKDKITKNESSDDSDEIDEPAKSESSLIKIVLEHSEATQTRPLRKTKVYDTGTQANELDIYMSLNTEEDRKTSIRLYTDLVLRSNATSAYSLHPEEVEDEHKHKRPSAPIIVDKGDLKSDNQGVAVSKMISWFRRLESQAPVPRRMISYILRRRTTRKSIPMSKSEESKVVEEEDTDDMIEEGVDDIPSLNQDYKIEDAQTILAQMKMFEAGERNLNKLISTDLTEFLDFNVMQLKGIDENEAKGAPVIEEREDIVALNKNLLKFKAEMEKISGESFSDDGFEEEEKFNMETKGKEMNNLLVRLIDNIFETDTKSRTQANVDTTLGDDTIEPSCHMQQSDMQKSDENLQTNSVEEIWKNTTREAWNKRNNIAKDTDDPERAMKKEEVEDAMRISDRESEPFGTSYDIIQNKTPTDGLSPLARELYEIRDVIEFYLHSKVEPLDWRVMIDRRAED